MARVKGAMMTRKHRSKVLGMAKGYWGNKHRHYKMANEQLMKSGRYAYVGRKQKKRDFRKLWITRISAACKANGLNYSTFMHGLKLAGVDINRKMLSEMAIHDAAAFTALCKYAKEGKVPAVKATKAAKAEEKAEAVAETAEKKPAAKKAAAPKAETAEKKPAAKKAAAPKAEGEEKKPAAKKAAAPKAETAEKKPAAKKAAAPKAEEKAE